MKKPTIAVVFGSRSTEHDISILTAIAAVIKPLELSQKYHVVPVYIAKDGQWYAGEKFKNVAFYQSSNVSELLQKETPVSLSLGKGLSLIKNSRLGRKAIKIDVVFPATHGTHGEDGELMAICEMANVPYVGCNVEAAVIAMDKVLAKQVITAQAIATPKYVPLTKKTYEDDPAHFQKQINSQLRYPLFVKPAHLGSSIGITRVSSEQDLANAIEIALHYDTKALAEEGVDNLVEVTLPIIGNDDLTPALLEEPLSSSEDFFDFDTKYMRGGKGKGAKMSGKGSQGAQGYSRIPAQISDDLYKQAEVLGLAVYRAVGCSGIARIDMLIDSKAQKVYFNEINPLPGSLYAHNWRKKGISNVELVDRLVQLALDRHQQAKDLTTNFATNFLKQF
jgi:D-alanine--D-alanine ligase